VGAVGPASGAPPGIAHWWHEIAGWRLRLTRPTGTEAVVGAVGPASGAPPGVTHWWHEIAGWRLRLTRPTGTEAVVGAVGPASGAPPGVTQWWHEIAGWRLRLTRPTKCGAHYGFLKHHLRPAGEACGDRAKIVAASNRNAGQGLGQRLFDQR